MYNTYSMSIRNISIYTVCFVIWLERKMYERFYIFSSSLMYIYKFVFDFIALSSVPIHYGTKSRKCASVPQDISFLFFIQMGFKQ